MGIVQQLVEGLAALVEHVDEWWDEEAMPEQLLAELSTAPQRSSVSASAPLPSFPDGMPPEAAAVLQQQLLAMPQIEPAHFRALPLVLDLEDSVAHATLHTRSPAHVLSCETAAPAANNHCSGQAQPGLEPEWLTALEAQVLDAACQWEGSQGGSWDDIPAPEEAGPGLRQLGGPRGANRDPTSNCEVMRFDDDSGGGYDAPSDFQRLQLEPGSGGSSWGVPETVTHAHGDHMGHRGGEYQGAGAGTSPLVPHSVATTTGRPSALNLLSMHGPMSEGSVEDLLGSGMDGFDWGGLSGGGDGEGGEEEQGWMVLGGMGGGGTSFHAGLVRRLVEQVEQGPPELTLAALRSLSCEAPGAGAGAAGGPPDAVPGVTPGGCSTVQLHAEDVLFAPSWPRLCLALPRCLHMGGAQHAQEPADGGEAGLQLRIFRAAAAVMKMAADEAVAVSPAHAAACLGVLVPYLTDTLVWVPAHCHGPAPVLVRQLLSHPQTGAHVVLAHTSLRLLCSLGTDWHFLARNAQEEAAQAVWKLVAAAAQSLELAEQFPGTSAQSSTASSTAGASVCVRPLHLLFLLDTGLQWLHRLASARCSSTSLLTASSPPWMRGSVADEAPDVEAVSAASPTAVPGQSPRSSRVPQLLVAALEEVVHRLRRQQPSAVPFQGGGLAAELPWHLVPALACALLSLPAQAWDSCQQPRASASHVMELLVYIAAGSAATTPPPHQCCLSWAFEGLVAHAGTQPHLFSPAALTHLLAHSLHGVLQQVRQGRTLSSDSAHLDPAAGCDNDTVGGWNPGSLVLTGLSASLCSALVGSDQGARALAAAGGDSSGLAPYAGDGATCAPSKGNTGSGRLKSAREASHGAALVAEACSILKLQLWMLTSRPPGSVMDRNTSAHGEEGTIGPTQDGHSHSSTTSQLVPGSCWALVHAAVSLCGAVLAPGVNTACAGSSGGEAGPGALHTASAASLAVSCSLVQQQVWLRGLVSQLLDVLVAASSTAAPSGSNNNMSATDNPGSDSELPLGSTRRPSDVADAACDALIAACAASPSVAPLLAQQALASRAVSVRLVARVRATTNITGVPDVSLMAAAGAMALSTRLARALVNAGFLHETVLQGLAHGMAGGRLPGAAARQGAGGDASVLRQSGFSMMEEVRGHCSGREADELAMGLQEARIDSCPRLQALATARAVLGWQQLVQTCLVDPAPSAPMGLHVLKSLVMWLDMNPSEPADPSGEGDWRGGAPAVMGPAAHRADTAHAALRCVAVWQGDPGALAALEAATHARWYLRQLAAAGTIEAGLGAGGGVDRGEGWLGPGRAPGLLDQEAPGSHPQSVEVQDMSVELAREMLARLDAASAGVEKVELLVEGVAGAHYREDGADSRSCSSTRSSLAGASAASGLGVCWGGDVGSSAIAKLLASRAHTKDVQAHWRIAAEAVKKDVASQAALPMAHLGALLQQLLGQLEQLERKPVRQPALQVEDQWLQVVVDHRWKTGGGGVSEADAQGGKPGDLALSEALAGGGRGDPAPMSPSLEAVRLVASTLPLLSPDWRPKQALADRGALPPPLLAPTTAPELAQTDVAALARCVDAAWLALGEAEGMAVGPLWGLGVGGDSMLVLASVLATQAATVHSHTGTDSISSTGIMDATHQAAAVWLPTEPSTAAVALILGLVHSPAAPFVWPALADASQPGGAQVSRVALCHAVTWVLRVAEPHLAVDLMSALGGGLSTAMHATARLLGFGGSAGPGLAGGLALCGWVGGSEAAKLMALAVVCGPDYLVYAAVAVAKHCEAQGGGSMGGAVDRLRAAAESFHFSAEVLSYMDQLCAMCRGQVLPFLLDAAHGHQSRLYQSK